MTAPAIPDNVVEAARQLRRRTHRSRGGSGTACPMRWVDVVAELERMGLGRWPPKAIARACSPPDCAIPDNVVEAARQLRERIHRSRGGAESPMRWVDVVAELERMGLGLWPPLAIARACAVAPLETHPRAPAPPEVVEQIRQSWLDGWTLEFPAEPFPGMAEAQRRLRERLRG